VPRDFFREFEHCLDRKKSREQNLQSVKAYYNRVRNRSDGLAEQEALKAALKIFATEATYQPYLAELRGAERTRGKEEAARDRRLQDDLKAERQRREEAEHQAALHAAQARLQTLQAESAKRRETERAQRLQRELEAERQVALGRLSLSGSLTTAEREELTQNANAFGRSARRRNARPSGPGIRVRAAGPPWRRGFWRRSPRQVRPRANPAPSPT
jgi:hypothetical protein